MQPEDTDRPPVDMSSGAGVEILQQRIAALTEAVAARDTFIAIAAHELRNPMTPMIGQIELLLSAVAAGRYSMTQIEQRLERVHRLMAHYIKRSATLLDVSRITSGNLKLVPTLCDLSAVMNQVARTFADATRHAGSVIGIDVPPSLAGTWDQLALEQIIDNLVSNAIKYGEARPIEIRAIDAGDIVRIEVRDHGPGISIEDRGRVFMRFERVVGSDARHSGFGVGLWVVGQLVDAMRGSISVEDAAGGGSLFSVTLPRHAGVQSTSSGTGP